MKYFLFFIVSVIFFFAVKPSFAVYDPISVPNNKIGIHILFPSELEKAKDLVNSSGGDWGYVTIPIQVGDKDIDKWQTFMDEARNNHLIPILRLATEGDYFNTVSWRKPQEADILDFANFLSSLEWPVKNRYIIIFNEVNRADEWDGESNPAEYANLLSYAVSVFKEKSPDYFIISAGLDNAASTGKGTYNEYDFLRLMYQNKPDVFSQIDGLSSHSYPNPGFSSPPNVKTRESISSFIYEQNLIQSLSGKKLPIFITETGWTQEKFSDEVIGNYFKTAISDTWNDNSIVAITPFLLRSGGSSFDKFSFLNNSGDPNKIYLAYKEVHKTAGKPTLNPVKILSLFKSAVVPVKNFSSYKYSTQERLLKDVVRWLFFGT